MQWDTNSGLDASSNLVHVNIAFYPRIIAGLESWSVELLLGLVVDPSPSVGSKTQCQGIQCDSVIKWNTGKLRIPDIEKIVSSQMKRRELRSKPQFKYSFLICRWSICLQRIGVCWVWRSGCQYSWRCSLHVRDHHWRLCVAKLYFFQDNKTNFIEPSRCKKTK